MSPSALSGGETTEAGAVTASETRAGAWAGDDAEMNALEAAVRAAVAKQGDAAAAAADPFWVRASIRARKGDASRASALLRSLVSWRAQLGLESADAREKVSALLRRGILWSSGQRERSGRYLVHVRIRYADPRSFSALDVVRTLATVIEWTLRTYPEAQTHGIIVFGDTAGIGLNNIDPRVPREIAHAFSSTLPVRIGGFCVMNIPWFIRPFFTIITSLLSRKLKSRVRQFSRPEELASQFEPASVPVDANMGGTLPWDLELQGKWVDRVMEDSSNWPPVTLAPMPFEKEELS